MRFCQHANRGVDGGGYGTGQEYDEFDGEEVGAWCIQMHALLYPYYRVPPTSNAFTGDDSCPRTPVKKT